MGEAAEKLRGWAYDFEDGSTVTVRITGSVRTEMALYFIELWIANKRQELASPAEAEVRG